MDMEGAVSEYRAETVRNSMIKTSHTAGPAGGCMVELTLSDGGADIFSLNVYAGNEVHAKSLEDGFRKNAEKVYNALLDTIFD
jgi:hypothetical protein